MSDYIKREDAIKSIKPMVGIWADDGRFYVDYQRVLDIINNELSADVVEVRHGKWSHNYVKDGMEYNDWFNLHCSVCGETQRDAWGKWNYCPYCGAKMDEEEQGNEDKRD